MIGIISALDEELVLFKENSDINQEVVQSGITFYFGRLSGHDVIILKCGVGKVNAAIATQLLIDRFGVNAVIFSGMAGSLVPYLNKSDIVVSNMVVQYDVDLSAFGRRPGEIPELARLIEAEPNLVKAAASVYEQMKEKESWENNMIVGTIATGDSFISDAKKIKWLQTEFGAVAVEMEGGAVGQVCQMNKVPFVVIRVISDGAGESAAADFIFSLEDASKITFSIVSNMLNRFEAKGKIKLLVPA